MRESRIGERAEVHGGQRFSHFRRQILRNRQGWRDVVDDDLERAGQHAARITGQRDLPVVGSVVGVNVTARDRRNRSQKVPADVVQTGEVEPKIATWG